ncbi:MAG: EAL domain-containing protein, partial [Chromatiales bacterium]|nr:EAL domain-containing protein [Chromatiales bacterium]
FYRTIRVQDMVGKPLVDRIQPVQLEGVPMWFIERFPLETPIGESTVMAGWVQAGQVIVRSHPGFAYRQLWQNAVDTFWWFLVSSLVVLLIGMSLLRMVLKPLRDIEHQANAIFNREFPVIEDLPKTVDLRRIVEAMNRMTAKVKQMLAELERLAEGLRGQAHRHPVTGLSNKRHFLNAVNTLLDTPEECSSAILALVELKAFKAYNDSRGYQAGDELLKEMAEALRLTADQLPKVQLAHLSGADFALFMQDCSFDDGRELGQKLSTMLAGIYGTGKLDEPDVGHVGMAYFDGGQTLSELLSQADMALRTAQSQEANAWYLCAPDEVDPNNVKTATDWRSAILDALETDRVVLQYQPVFACTDRQIMHHEVFVRFKEKSNSGQDTLVSAGVFMPQAESLGLTAEIDRAVIGKVLNRLMYEQDQDHRYAVNISPPSIQRSTFINWLGEQLSEHRAVSHRLIFEMPEYGAVSQLKQVQQFIELVKSHGAAFSLDHFGRSHSAFGYLKSIKADYLKIDGSYLRELHDNTDNQFFIQALSDIAHGLEIEVIGETIETEQTWVLLPELNVDGGQGYYLGRPE